jgi:CrcB protein
MKSLLLVGIGGFFGSCARYLATLALGRHLPWFPFGTLASNAVAALLIGFLIGMERGGLMASLHARPLLVSGLLGGLSTFSSFSLETVELLERSRYAAAGANTLLNLGLSLSLVALGLFLAKALRAG